MPWVDSLEVALLKRGYSTGAAAYVRLLAVNLQEQTLAVVPITLQLVLTIAIFFQRAPNAPGELVGGMLCAIVGLTLFTDSLRICVMPLGELIGREMPRKLPQAATLFIALCLGTAYLTALAGVACIPVFAAASAMAGALCTMCIGTYVFVAAWVVCAWRGTRTTGFVEVGRGAVGAGALTLVCLLGLLVPGMRTPSSTLRLLFAHS